MMLGWPFPEHVFDLHTAYLAASNVLLPYDPDENRNKPRKGLSDACRAYGIDGWEGIDKPTMAKDIGEGRWQKYGQDAVSDYCEEDVETSTKLLRRQIRGHLGFPPPTWSACCTGPTTPAGRSPRSRPAACRIDVPLWNLVQENKARRDRAT